MEQGDQLILCNNIKYSFVEKLNIDYLLLQIEVGLNLNAKYFLIFLIDEIAV